MGYSISGGSPVPALVLWRRMNAIFHTSARYHAVAFFAWFTFEFYLDDPPDNFPFNLQLENCQCVRNRDIPVFKFSCSRCQQCLSCSASESLHAPKLFINLSPIRLPVQVLFFDCKDFFSPSCQCQWRPVGSSNSSPSIPHQNCFEKFQQHFNSIPLQYRFGPRWKDVCCEPQAVKNVNFNKLIMLSPRKHPASPLLIGFVCFFQICWTFSGTSRLATP